MTKVDTNLYNELKERGLLYQCTDEETLKKMLETKPENVITHAVKGMLPKNALGRSMMKKLRVYAGPEHEHQAQKPEVLEIK